MHSLHYLLPLLRYGVRSGDQEMVDRFYYLIKDWLHDNPPGGLDQPLRLGPADLRGLPRRRCSSAPPPVRGAASSGCSAACSSTGRCCSDPRRYEGVNNASLHQSMGLYSLGEAMMRPTWRATAISREASLAVKLIQAGRLRRGRRARVRRQRLPLVRPGRRAAAPRRRRRAGRTQPLHGRCRPSSRRRPGPTARSRRSATPARPRWSRRGWTGTAAEFPASGGASGVARPSAFSSFAGGYVFGRSGWGTSRPLADETFFSVRGGRPPRTRTTTPVRSRSTRTARPCSSTPGKWRYTYGTTRSFVVSRAAHNAVLVNGVKRTRLRPEMSRDHRQRARHHHGRRPRVRRRDPDAHRRLRPGRRRRSSCGTGCPRRPGP